MRLYFWFRSLVSDLFVPRLSRAPRRRERRQYGFESLETRAVFATYSLSGTTLNIDLDAANQKLQIYANGTSYVFALSTATTNTWTLSGTLPSGHSITSSAANLTTANLSAFNAVNITDSAANTSVWFETGTNGTFSDNFNINLDNLSTSVVFNGTNTFNGTNSLSVTIDSRAEVPSAKSLTMTNGNLDMSINMQTTPQTLLFSGLLVNNGTIQTTGTGQTTIAARGGNGIASSFYNKGVAVVGGGTISGGTNGTLSITGYGYNNLSIDSNTKMYGQGVFVSGKNAASVISQITSLGANVAVTGYGANDTTANLASISANGITNAGVVVGCQTTSLTGFGLITSGGNGTVSVTGYGGSLVDQPVVDTSNSNNFAKPMGVLVSGGCATISSGGAGLVNVTGFGGGTTANSLWGTGVSVYNGNINSGANGSVAVNGTGFLNSNTQQQFGVLLYGTGCISTGAGSGHTTVAGQGGGSGNGSSFNVGVYLYVGGTITAGGSGDVTVTGTGGSAASSRNRGVYLAGNGQTTPMITSNGGNVLVTGYGGNGGVTTSFAVGVDINANSRITAGGQGDVTVRGYGGNNNGTLGNTNHGVYMTSSGSGQMPSFISSSGGNVTVLGIGGGGDANSTANSPMANNVGVFIQLGSYITAGGMGNVTVTGQGGGRSPGATGSNNHGVWVSDGNRTTYSANNMAYSCITSSGGQVTVTGTGGGGSGNTSGSSSGSNYGVYVNSGGSITAGGNADVAVTGTGGNYGNTSSTGANNHGVLITGSCSPTSAPAPYISTLTTGGSGNLTVIGNGGGSGTGGTNYGIYVTAGALVTAGGATSSVTLNGQGGNTTGQQNYGVHLNNTSAASGLTTTVTSAGGNVNITGCAPLSSGGANQHGVAITAAIVKSGGDGSLTITGRAGKGDTGVTGNGHIGVQIAGGANISSGGSGPVNITGYGGGNGARPSNHGVVVNTSGVITGGANAPVTVTGYGGNADGTGGDNYGVQVNGGKILSSNGPVLVTGFAGQTNTTVSSTSGNNTGVCIVSAGEISATGSGAVTVNGTGGGLGTGATGTNHGVTINTLTGSNTPKISSEGGLITVIGTAGGINGSGSNNNGVEVKVGGLIATTGSGTNITITGTGGGKSNAGASNHGIYLAGCSTVSNLTVTANGGGILLRGIQGEGSASRAIFANSSVATVIGNVSAPGNVTIVADSAALSEASDSAIHADPQLIITPRTTSVGVDLGNTSDTANGPLAISDSELAKFNAPSIQLGNSTTGNVTISAGIAVPSGSNLTLMSNGTNSVLFATACATGGMTMGAGKTLDVSTLPIIASSIGGTSLGIGYTRLKVVGDLSIAGKTLSLSGGFTPAAGNVFTIVNATNLTGTFTGLADGSTVTFNGKTLIVNYTATSVTLTEPSPLVTTPPSSSTVTAGSTATFTAAASGTPTPTVQWQVSTNAGATWSDITGATNTTLSFTAAIADDGKLYRAVFTNSYGTATTDNAALTVQAAPAITTHPSDQTVNPGDTATFTAAASGTPTPTVQWQVSTNSGSTWSDIAGETNATYSFTTALGDNANQYRAVFTNAVSSATTSAATLTVGSGTVAPAVTGNPADSTVTAGATASFTASASGNPAPTVKWQLSTNSGSSWSDIAGATSTTYSFTAAAGDNGKQYRAVFTNGVGSGATTTAATLTVQYAPTITSGNAATFAAGLNESFQVVATGNPASSFSITSGSLPSGVTLDPTTGALSGKAALGTAGTYPVTISANNGIGTPATQAFTLTVVNQLSNVQISKGQVQRSYLRYIDLAMANSSVATQLAATASTRIKLVKRDLNGNNPSDMSLTGLVSASGSNVTIDFGAQGIGGARNTNLADGYYTLQVDLDSDGTYETSYNFFRLFGDTNGDGKVDQTDVNNVTAGMTAYSVEYDLNFDGRVNSSDLIYVKRALNRSLNPSLPLG